MFRNRLSKLERRNNRAMIDLVRKSEDVPLFGGDTSKAARLKRSIVLRFTVKSIARDCGDPSSHI